VRRAGERARADADRAGERKAAAALAQIGSSSIPALTRLLADPDEEVGELAAKIMGWDIGAPALPALRGALRSKVARRRAHAVSALDSLGADAGAAIPQLVRRLKDRDGQVSWRAARALGNMKARAAARALVASLVGATFRLRLESVYALMKIGPPLDEARPVLTRLLQEEGRGWRFRTPAAILLQRLGGDAKLVVPVLAEALENGRPDFEEAAAALAAVGQEAVPALLGLLRHERPEVRRRAAPALERAGVGAGIMIPDLIELLRRSASLT
jgi:HEAT repeat protein